MKRLKWFIYVVIALFIAFLNILAWNSQGFCDWYISHVFPIWINTYGRLTGIFPFSVGEFMIMAGIFLVIAASLLGVILLVTVLVRKRVFRKRAGEVSLRSMDMLSVSLARQEKRRRGNSWQRFCDFCKGYYQFFAWVLLAVSLVMTLNCFILYHGSTFSEKYFTQLDGYDVQKEYSLEELVALREHVVHKCNTLSKMVERDADGNIVYQGNMAAEAKSAMKNLGETYDILSGFYPNPKPLLYSDFMSQQYMTGYYFPFSMEANYNDVMYLMNMPATFCHELAHLKGFIYEDEANFIAYLACIGSGDLVFEYAGYLSVLNYIDNDFYKSIGKDKERYLAEMEILPQVHKDNIFLTQEEWDRIEDKAVLSTETVDALSDSFTDTTLKLNGVSDGMVSYSRVVKLLLQYYDIYGYPKKMMLYTGD